MSNRVEEIKAQIEALTRVYNAQHGASVGSLLAHNDLMFAYAEMDNDRNMMSLLAEERIFLLSADQD